MAKNNIEEEVTITPVIKDLERLFNRFVQFIISIFSGILSGLVYFLKFCFKNFLLLLIFSVIGLLLGFYSNTLVKPSYTSDLILELNIDARNQLSADVNYFKALIENEEFEALAEILQISLEEAHSLKDISIIGSSSYANKMSTINSFYEELDSSLQNNIEFDNLFDPEVTDFDDLYTITLEASNKSVFSKLEPQLIAFFERVPELQALRQANKDNLLYEKEVYLKEMARLDTLRKVLNTVMIEQAKSKTEGSVTNITMDQKSDTRDFQILDVYNRYLNYSKEVVALDLLIDDIDKCYTVNSHFSNFGAKVGFKKLENSLVFGLTFFLIASILILLKNFRKNLIQ